uniref:Hexosyltransferase n=1 Tax=Salarias fasciatus TaxID=181472 RepID=A0A672FPM9_SALFA
MVDHGSLHHQKKAFFQQCFQFLILFCLALVLCYMLSSSFLSLKNFLEQNRSEEPPGQPGATGWYQYHQAYPKNYHFVMDNADICTKKTPFLVLMVPVSPDDVAARDAIRQTWGNNSLVQGEVVVTLFMLGLSHRADAETLKQENLQHMDLIQSDFLDTYLNLTIKTMVIMDWLATRCSEAAYAMKVDSDMFLNIDNLVIMLQKPGIPRENYLTGMLMWNRPVIRWKFSKWYVSKAIFPESTYPTYTLGMGYVFSNDLPKKYVEISKSIKPFNIEDAYIGMCMKKLDLELTSPPVPSQFQAYNSRYDRCEFSKVITYILDSPEQLLEYWTDLKKPGPPCTGHIFNYLFVISCFILVFTCLVFVIVRFSFVRYSGSS